MERKEYNKAIPSFFQLLLDRLTKLKLYYSDNIEAWTYTSYHPTKDGINLCTSKLLKLSHELAHMLEIRDNDRLLQLDYGIKRYVPLTTEGQLMALAREARVRGIQTRLVHIAFNHLRMLYHRSGPVIFFRVGSKFGKFNSLREVEDWSFAITDSAYNKWSEDKILHVWSQKADFINHWLETKHPSQQDYDRQIARNAV